MRHLTLPLALCAVLVTAAGVVGCGGGGGVPGDAVATVDGVAIEQRSFDHWLAITAKTTGKREADVRDQVMQMLVSSRWIEGEAEDRGISVDEADVKQDFERQKKLSFPQDADFQRFLKTSGQTEKDILERVRLDLLSSRIRDEVTGGEAKITAQQVADHYKSNKANFKQPEQRDLRIVLASSRAKAGAARAALAGGASWSSVARRYSIDRTSRSDGGRQLAVTRGQQEKALGDAVFKARVGKLTGPVKAQHGYSVFEVTRVFQARQQSLDEAEPTIEKLLVSDSRRQKLDEFTEELRDKWRPRTDCRQGYITADCANGPSTPAQQAGAAQP
jgi:foldase protein PrsA